MNLIKIGKFIAASRKNMNLTQEGLAEKLGITDRAVSKWERGISLPDADKMLELCNILDIKVNELLVGEKIDMNDYEKKNEELLLEMTRLKEQRDKELLTLEIFIGIIVSIIMFACIFIASFADMKDWLRVVLIIIGIIPFAIGISYAIRIEQIAGYYECPNCNHKYIPTYKSVLFAMHVNRTRKMKCPKCGKKGWHKKVLK